MELLELEIEHHGGRILKQVKRTDKAAIYALYGVQDFLFRYEVIVVKISPYAEFEVYPGDEEWGRFGWSFAPTDRERAEAAYAWLNANINVTGLRRRTARRLQCKLMLLRPQLREVLRLR
jgi:hypothetical protein